MAPERLILDGTNILIVAPAHSTGSWMARALVDWGARTSIAADAHAACLLLAHGAWNAILVDRALGAAECTQLAGASAAVSRRIVLVTPGERGEIAALKKAGFTGYLVKPVRADSLAALMAAIEGGPDHSGGIPQADTCRRRIACATNGLSVLVAEDNEINALLAKSLLRRLGHHPTVVSTGEAVVAAYLHARRADLSYDLLLMDLHMPGGDGIEAAKRIRAMEAAGDGRRLPIFALTATALDEDRITSLAAGMDGFLVKPLDRGQLTDILAKLSAAAAQAAESTLDSLRQSHARPGDFRFFENQIRALARRQNVLIEIQKILIRRQIPVAVSMASLSDKVAYRWKSDLGSRNAVPRSVIDQHTSSATRARRHQDRLKNRKNPKHTGSPYRLSEEAPSAAR